MKHIFEHVFISRIYEAYYLIISNRFKNLSQGTTPIGKKSAAIDTCYSATMDVQFSIDGDKQQAGTKLFAVNIPNNYKTRKFSDWLHSGEIKRSR